MTLTEPKVRDLPAAPKGKRRRITDDRCAGLVLRIEDDRSKSWWHRFTDKSGGKAKRREKHIGDYPGMTLADARIKVAMRSAPRSDAPSVVTIAQLCDEHEQRHLPTLREQARPRRVLAMLRDRWGPRPAVSITRAEVSALYHEIRSRPSQRKRKGKPAGVPYEAKRTITFIATLFELADQWGLIKPGHANPARGVAKFTGEKRERWVKHEEMPRLRAAIDACDHPVARAALLFDLCTGARIGEVLAAKWADIDTSRREWTIPTPKQGKPHVVALTDAALAVLADVPRAPGNPHVFPGLRPGAALVGLQKIWERIRIAAGLPDVRLHDLRRTVGSWMASDGVSLAVIGNVLGHAPGSPATAVYARLAESAQRDALESYAARMASVMSPPSSGDSAKRSTRPGRRGGK